MGKTSKQSHSTNYADYKSDDNVRKGEN